MVVIVVVMVAHGRRLDTNTGRRNASGPFAIRRASGAAVARNLTD